MCSNRSVGYPRFGVKDVLSQDLKDFGMEWEQWIALFHIEILGKPKYMLGKREMSQKISTDTSIQNIADIYYSIVGNERRLPKIKLFTRSYTMVAHKDFMFYFKLIQIGFKSSELLMQLCSLWPVDSTRRPCLGSFRLGFLSCESAAN